MIFERPKNIDKDEWEHIVAFLRYAQKSAFYFWQYPEQNITVDISLTDHHDDDDRPDPLRLPEILIVIAVLLVWCASILIFIRHSELLRIRQRDIPFRSTMNTSMNLNRITVVNRTSDLTIQGKSRPSTISGLTPPTLKQMFSSNKHSEVVERIALVLPPVLQKRRHTHTFHSHSLSHSKLSLEHNHDKQQFLHPERTSLDVQRISRDLHLENLQPKSENNLSTNKYSISYSTNNILKTKINDDIKCSMNRKRCIQESPV